MDLVNMKATKVGVFTDPTVAKLDPMLTVRPPFILSSFFLRERADEGEGDAWQTIKSLEKHGVAYEIFDRVAVEPTDKSWQEAIDWSRERDISHFVACVLLFPDSALANLGCASVDRRLEELMVHSLIQSWRWIGDRHGKGGEPVHGQE